jgi:hypothetical protein
VARALSALERAHADLAAAHRQDRDGADDNTEHAKSMIGQIGDQLAAWAAAHREEEGIS